MSFQLSDNILKVVSRHSTLARLQVEEIFYSFPGLNYELHTMDSYGDRNKQISLIGNTMSDIFTKELDELILKGEADLAVHSAKDLPYPLPAGIEVIALFEAFDQTDAFVSHNSISLTELEAGKKIGTSSAARIKELKALRPDLEVVSIRGTIEERIASVDNGTVDGLIVATCALKRLGLEHRIAEILPFATHPLQGNLAITAKKERADLKKLFQSKDILRTYGKVVLAGFGPGDPELLTIKATKALAGADVIFYDDLLDDSALDKYPAEKIYVGKRKNAHSYHQEEINELLYQSAVAGKQVVRLKGGDPMVFAHGREEIDYLKSRLIQVEVIPGVSSGIALAACTGIPLTHRGIASSVAFVSGHSGKKAQIPDTDTLVYFMSGATIPAIARKLIHNGRKEQTPVALVYNVSHPSQKTYFSTLGELRSSTFSYPTPVIIVIGEVVNFEKRLNSPGKILVTGTNRDDYKGEGEIIHTPLIRIEKKEPDVQIRQVMKTLSEFDWICFTSRYGVKYFFEALKITQTDIRVLKNVRIASVGKTTTETLSGYLVVPDFESPTESTEGLIDYFRKEKIKEKKILLPRSDKGLAFLSEELEKLQNRVLDIAFYRNKLNEDALKYDLAGFRKIVFGSPSGVDAFLRLYGSIPKEIELEAKGKTTENYLRKKLG